MKRVIYTCIAGDYDKLRDPLITDPNFDYIAFTNNKLLKSNIWKIRYFDTEGLDDTRAARRVKILCTEYLKEYDLSVWVDANIQIKSTLIDLVLKAIDSFDIVTLTHGRNCIYKEAKVCEVIGKDSSEVIRRQMKFYIAQGYPKNNGLVATGILIRKHSQEIDSFMRRWWEIVRDYSKRDQLSFNYILWRYPLKVNQLPFEILRDSIYFNLEKHQSRTIPKPKPIKIRRGHLVQR